MKLSFKTLLLLAIPSLAFGQETQIDSTTITASSDAPADGAQFGAEHTLDAATLEGFRDTGDAGPPMRPTQHQGNHWITEDGNLTATITFDLGGTFDLTRMEILNTSNTNWNDRETDSFTVETSTDGGVVWSAPSTPIFLQDYVDGFQDVPFWAPGISHIRLNVENVDNADDVTDGTNDVAVGLNEVRFFSTPPDDTDNDGLPDNWELENFGDLSHIASDDDDVDEFGNPAPDGLTNAEELENTTDPLDPDTDGDGLSDGDEINTHNSDPNKTDTDDDTLTDADEVNLHGSDPNLPDTDGDGLFDADEVNTHMTLPNNADTDGDNIADDIEIIHLMTDPLVFTDRPGLIIPSTIIATAGSTQEPRFDVQNLVDDKTLEGFRRDVDPDGIRPMEHQDNHWMADQGVFTETITFDLAGTYDLTHMEVLNTSNTNWNDAETDTFTIATSTDGGTSFSAPSADVALQDYLDGFQNVPLVASGVTHVQLVVTNGDDGDGSSEARVGLNEVRFFTGNVAPLQIASLDYLSGATSATITWNSNLGANYLVEFSDNLITWDEAPDGESVPATGTSTSFTIDYDPAAPVAKRFFRVTRLP